MTSHQIIALSVLLAVVAALIRGKVRADVVALAGTAVLLALGVVKPVQAQAAFASPALITLASLFVVIHAMELSGLLGAVIRAAIRLCARFGQVGIWMVIAGCGAASAFLNNTPIVVLGAPVIADMARSLGQSSRRFLIPLSYVTILGGACTLIGTSTNLLVNDMARTSGQPAFSMFEATPVALVLAVTGGLYLLVAAPLLLRGPTPADAGSIAEAAQTADRRSVAIGEAAIFVDHPPLDLPRALAAFLVFIAVVTVAAIGLAPIAAAAFAGAVVLILLNVITAEQAYRGLRPEILLLIAGMVVVGMSLETSGLAAAATDALTAGVIDFNPLVALALLYGITLVLTEILSNAAVAVLVTPVAITLAESLGVDPRPFIVAVMMAASAAFATPFGYQTNVLVYDVGNYAYMDFVRIGLPLNILTWIVGSAAIHHFFPF